MERSSKVKILVIFFWEFLEPLVFPSKKGTRPQQRKGQSKRFIVTKGLQRFL